MAALSDACCSSIPPGVNGNKMRMSSLASRAHNAAVYHRRIDRDNPSGKSTS